MTEPTPGREAPRWLSVVAVLQLPLLVVVIAIYAFVAARLPPLLRERRALTLRVQADSLRADSTRMELASLRVALLTAREAINAYHAGQYAVAIEGYNAALAQHPGDSYLLDLKGYAFFKAGQLDSAVATLSQSVRSNPDFAWGYFYLARAECRAHHPAALESGLTAIRKDPEMKERMLADPEFRSVCAAIIPSLVQAR